MSYKHARVHTRRHTHTQRKQPVAEAVRNKRNSNSLKGEQKTKF